MYDQFIVSKALAKSNTSPFLFSTSHWVIVKCNNLFQTDTGFEVIQTISRLFRFCSIESHLVQFRGQ